MFGSFILVRGQMFNLRHVERIDFRDAQTVSFHFQGGNRQDFSGDDAARVRRLIHDRAVLEETESSAD